MFWTLSRRMLAMEVSECLAVENSVLIVADFHLFFERPPMDQSDRWAARPFRSYTTVHPPYSVSLDPVATRRDKLRFVHNLWAAQALARAKLLPQEVRQVPRALVEEEEIGLESAGEMCGRAKCYWNVWERQGWLQADRKVGANGKQV
jgi:hypothetical protein